MIKISISDENYNYYSISKTFQNLYILNSNQKKDIVIEIFILECFCLEKCCINDDWEDLDIKSDNKNFCNSSFGVGTTKNGGFYFYGSSYKEVYEKIIDFIASFIYSKNFKDFYKLIFPFDDNFILFVGGKVLSFGNHLHIKECSDCGCNCNFLNQLKSIKEILV